MGCRGDSQERGDPLVAAVAARQHGVVSAAQLAEAGLGRGAVDLRVRRGRLLRLHRGVYAFGHAELTWWGRLWAAVLACGGPTVAAISHRTAAALHDLMTAPWRIDVVTLRASHSTAAIRVHRSVTLRRHRDIITRDDGLPVTTVARTITDLAGILSPQRLERVCHEAEIRRVLNENAIERILRQAPSTKGAKALRQALASLTPTDPDLTRSELENRFLSLVARYHLPRPRTNARVGRHEVDFLWPDQRVIAETDGAATHLTATAFEEDRRRDAELQRVGYRVVRFTWRQVVREPDHVAATLGAVL